MPLTAKELHALSNVVAYMLEGEENHYLQCDPDMQPFHVYRDVIILDQLLKRRKSRNPMTQECPTHGLYNDSLSIGCPSCQDNQEVTVVVVNAKILVQVPDAASVPQAYVLLNDMMNTASIDPEGSGLRIVDWEWKQTAAGVIDEYNYEQGDFLDRT